MFLLISEKTLSAEYPEFTADHSVVNHFQLKHAVLVKSRTKSAGLIWQVSHFCQYLFFMNANWLIYSIQGVGSKGQTISFSESSHVAYQIKADDASSNMVVNILPTDTPSTQGVGLKGQTISFTENSHVAYQIKGN